MVELSKDAMLVRLGAEIREARESLDISQHELGELIGVSRSAINKVESGINEPPLHKYLLMMHYLHREWQNKPVEPRHPALDLYDHLCGKRPRLRVVPA